MLFEAFWLVAAGVVALLLPRSTGYRQHLVRRTARQADAPVPATVRPLLEARVARQAYAGGVGIALAGASLQVLALAGVPREVLTDPVAVLSAMVIGATLCVAAVEIWWPGTPQAGPRAARVTSPGIRDYLPTVVAVSAWVVAGVGTVAILAALLLGQTRWFDWQVVWHSPMPALAVALPVVGVLCLLAVRRVLDAPQPARDESELYWQDVLRSSTLSSLLIPPALLSLWGMVVVGGTLDAAASSVAEQTGVVGPSWTLAFLVAGYAAPVVVLVLILLFMARVSGTTEIAHMRGRLWDGRAPQPAASEAAPGERA